ncbi:hypothetical protein [Sinorhizobium meliloti]|uniref:hypothetical protein n=1 Tax=Rhizobium meliloti TaxID=382 RepID=UPI000FD73E8E|nr:hypothetical protein [Sinorhizobium meliloti]RVJ38049.1 hypothetical protein CN175_34795 [Sinorhizobium meliloti]
MKYYAGLDVSQQTTSICIVDDEGKTVAERKVASCPEAISEALEPFAVTRAGLETGSLSVWLWNGLKGPGRDDGYPSPPGQIRTCGTTAYGSYRML